MQKIISQLNYIIRYGQDTKALNQHHTPLNRDSIHTCAYLDASFASNLYLTSQLGFIIRLYQPLPFYELQQPQVEEGHPIDYICVIIRFIGRFRCLVHAES